MAINMQVRRGTAAAWTAANPTLLAGEIGYETDSKLFKVGDGATAWVSLGYGLQGAAGLDGFDGLQGLQGNPGIDGIDAGGGTAPPPVPVNSSGGLSAVTTINNTVTDTTCGVTLPNQVAQASSVWRVRGWGQFVAVSSATARNAQIRPYWGATALPLIAPAVLVSVAQTTNWQVEFLLVATSVTAVWVSGMFNNKVSFPAIVAATTSQRTLDNATPASTVVTAGGQAIDLRASMSVSVATDQWLIHAVKMERLK